MGAFLNCFMGLVMCLNIALIFACMRTPPLDKITVKSDKLVDLSGRVRIFHGFNAVNKGPPWYPEYLLNNTKLDLYQSWGFNAVRLGMMWTGLEPKEGQFNQTYIDVMSQIVTKLQDHGMYVILDMHQDVLSSAFQSYDGIPKWLLEKLPPSPNSFPWPLPPFSNQSWALGYLTQATGIAFQGIYDNYAGSLDHFVTFWQTVAQSFSSYTSVLGYELINEPWAGDIYSNPLLLLPGLAGQANLQHVYNRLSLAIREVDSDTLIFYEPVTWGVFLNGNYTGSGFQSVPGGHHFQNNSVFSYHYYCWLLNAPVENTATRSLSQDICDQVIGVKMFEAVKAEVKRLGGSAFLTEFGLCEPDGDPASEGTTECEFVLRQADNHLQSWTYWDSKFFDDLGNVRSEVIHPFARPFAYAISGQPLSMHFTIETSEFRFVFLPDAEIAAPTLIYVPPLHYPYGINVVISPEMDWIFNPALNLVEIFNSHEISEDAEVIVIIMNKHKA